MQFHRIIFDNASPIYSVLLSQKWYLLLRVSTRFWLTIQFVIFYLSGLAIESASGKKKIIIYLLTVLAIAESVFLGWKYLAKPITRNNNLAPKEVYQYLNSDKSLFRVFCLTRCLSQKESSIYNLQLLDGYSTVQLRNFNEESWQLTGSYWNYYTLSVPPIGTYTLERLSPDIKSLGEYNVKYVISPYPIVNQNLKLKKGIDGFNIYENKLFLPRAYFKAQEYTVNEIPILDYSPNSVTLDTSHVKIKQVILSEVYSKGWRAYLNDVETSIMQTPNALRAVDINETTKTVKFTYFPKSYIYGIILTYATILFVFISGIFWVAGWTNNMRNLFKKTSSYNH